MPLSSSPLILLLLIAFRLINALILRTFFQPDEFFQSLEPAWQIAFGPGSGTWITWEWKHKLRSSLHPLLFSGVYYIINTVAQILHLLPSTHADLLIAAPKAVQAVIAAIGDYYTWKLARRIYGRSEGQAALALTVLSPWQWFCSTRTLSNCLETTLTITALYLWPWECFLGSVSMNRANTSRRSDRSRRDSGNLTRLRRCLPLAALACILRPTNTLIWGSVGSVALLRGSWRQRRRLVREVLICGVSAFTLSALADRLFYGEWTFPPFMFLYFNVVQSLAVFYGRNDWHYYLSQGYPLLLTTALPFTLAGLCRALVGRSTSGVLSNRVQMQFAWICVITPFVLSLISHKEVRFIYPLLPLLHTLSAPVLVRYFSPAIYRSSRAYTPRRLILLFLLLANVTIAIYTTIYHASGTISVLSYLREQRQTHSQGSSWTVDTKATGISVGFLMPCHSTPWRSHLVYPDVYAWALSCEPPVSLEESHRAVYLDEADQFYANPGKFLHENMEGGLRHIPGKPSYVSPRFRSNNGRATTAHPWPDYLVFFAQLEPTLQSLLRASSYTECWRTFNTAWHDDWRRRGDIIVWCLDPVEQQSWRSESRKKSADSKDRLINKVTEKLKVGLLPDGKPKFSFQRWMTAIGWRWPWEKRQRSPWASQLSQWVTSWRPRALFFGEKRKNKGAVERERDLWS